MPDKISKQTFKIINFQFAVTNTENSVCQPIYRSYMTVKDNFYEEDKSTDLFALGLVLLEMEIEMSTLNFYLNRIIYSFFNVGKFISKESLKKMRKGVFKFVEKWQTSRIPDQYKDMMNVQNDEQRPLVFSIFDYFRYFVVCYYDIDEIIKEEFHKFVKEINSIDMAANYSLRFNRKYDLRNLAEENSTNIEIRRKFAEDSYKCFFMFVTFLKETEVKGVFIEFPLTPGNSQTRLNRTPYGYYLEVLFFFVSDPNIYHYTDRTLHSLTRLIAILEGTGDIKDFTNSYSESEGDRNNITDEESQINPDPIDCGWKEYLKTAGEMKPTEKKNLKEDREVMKFESKLESPNSKNVSEDKEAEILKIPSKRDHQTAFLDFNSESREQSPDLKKVNQSGENQSREYQIKQKVTRILNQKRIRRKKNILLC